MATSELRSRFHRLRAQFGWTRQLPSVSDGLEVINVLPLEMQSTSSPTPSPTPSLSPSLSPSPASSAGLAVSPSGDSSVSPDELCAVVRRLTLTSDGDGAGRSPTSPVRPVVSRRRYVLDSDSDSETDVLKAGGAGGTSEDSADAPVPDVSSCSDVSPVSSHRHRSVAPADTDDDSDTVPARRPIALDVSSSSGENSFIVDDSSDDENQPPPVAFPTRNRRLILESDSDSDQAEEGGDLSHVPEKDSVLSPVVTSPIRLSSDSSSNEGGAADSDPDTSFNPSPDDKENVPVPSPSPLVTPAPRRRRVFFPSDSEEEEDAEDDRKDEVRERDEKEMEDTPDENDGGFGPPPTASAPPTTVSPASSTPSSSDSFYSCNSLPDDGPGGRLQPTPPSRPPLSPLCLPPPSPPPPPSLSSLTDRPDAATPPPTTPVSTHSSSDSEAPMSTVGRPSLFRSPPGTKTPIGYAIRKLSTPQLNRLLKTPTPRPPSTATKPARRTPIAPTSCSRVPRRTPASSSTSRSSPKLRTQDTRDSLTALAFDEFNAQVFNHKLPADLRITWNAKLRRTAGLTYSKRTAGGRYESRVELSVKVLDTHTKLRKTLLHELCHVAAWLVDHVAKPPHGAHFWAWGKRATAVYPDLAVSRCHAYDIDYKFRYQCTNTACGAEVGRHSKSVKLDSQVCGRCGSRFALLSKLKKDGTPAKKRKPTAFSLFVKEHFAAVKASASPGTKHGEIMQRLSAKWKAAKEVGLVGAGAGAGAGVGVGAGAC